MDKDIFKVYSVDNNDFRIRHVCENTYIEMKKNHNHKNYELYYLLDGEKIFIVNNKVYKVKKGELMFIHPSDTHKSISIEGIALNSILLNVKSSFFNDMFRIQNMELFDFMKTSQKLSFNMKDLIAIEKVLFDMLNECEKEESNYNQYLKCLQFMLFLNIDRYYIKDNKKINVNNTVETKLEEILTYISENYNKDISLNTISEKFFLSNSYLSRSFKKFYGCNLSEYIQIIRIGEAQKILATTDKKVLDIAYDVGFKEIAHFNKTFKKITKISPLKYRSSIKVNKK